MPSRARTAGALAALILIWGTTWSAIRIGLVGIPPLTGVALRFALAGVVLLALARAFRVPLGRSRRERALWGINALFSFTISYGVVYWGEQYVPSGLTAVLFATFPLFVAVLAHFTLPGERLSPIRGLGVLVGFLGVGVIFSEDLARLDDPFSQVTGGGGGPGIAVAATVILISPLVSAIANIAVKRWGQGVHPLSLTAVPMLATAAVMGALAALVERHEPVELTPVAVGTVVYLALFGSAVTFTLYFWLLSHLRATQLSLITYAVPVVAVLVGALLLDEPLTLRLASGAALVVAGCAAAAR